MTSRLTTGSSVPIVSWCAKRLCARFPKFCRLRVLPPIASLCQSSPDFPIRRTVASGSQAFRLTWRCSVIRIRRTGKSIKGRQRHLSASRMARRSGGTASETSPRFGLQARQTPLMASGHSYVAASIRLRLGCSYGLSAPMHVLVQVVVLISEGSSSRLEAFCSSRQRSSSSGWWMPPSKNVRVSGWCLLRVVFQRRRFARCSLSSLSALPRYQACLARLGFHGFTLSP